MGFDLHAFMLRAPMILFAITIHEYMHARMALMCGDPTAKNMGRVTLNPIAHLDPIGTICLVFLPIGWGKPVPVNVFNLRNPKRDDVLVSVAGPASNIAVAIAIGLLLRLIPWRHCLTDLGPFPAKCFRSLLQMLYVGLMINIGLAVFNMLPLFPLDGSHVVRGLLPERASMAFERFSRYAPGILIGLILFEHVLRKPLLSAVLIPPIGFLARLIAGPIMGS